MTVTFSSEATGARREVTSQLPNAERKALSIQNLISRGNILQEYRGNQDILRIKKTENFLPEDPP